MKKTRRHYDRALKISVVAELESGKPLSQIACEHSIHSALMERRAGRESERALMVMEIIIRTKQGLQNLRDCSARLMSRFGFFGLITGLLNSALYGESINRTLTLNAHEIV